MKKIGNAVSWAVVVAIASSLAIVMPAFAQANVGVGVGVGANVGVNVQGGIHDGANGGAYHGGMMVGGGIFGTVSAVNGDTLTVAGNAHFARPMPEQPAMNMPVPKPMIEATTTYTVDATNAKIYKGGATSTVSVSDIAVGDTVVVQGTVSGTNIAATVIRDGVIPMMMGRPGMPGKGFGHGASSTTSGTPPFQGNGEPVVGGKITNVNGTTITVTNASNVTYTIDAASATIVKNGTSTAVGNLTVGDSVIVQGVVNGNSVTASSIIDQGVKVSPGNASSSAPRGIGLGLGAGIGGFFGAIGGFFQHLFGF